MTWTENFLETTKQFTMKLKGATYQPSYRTEKISHLATASLIFKIHFNQKVRSKRNGCAHK